jgi:integrating conjugative element protein (TIGR03765 family)
VHADLSTFADEAWILPVHSSHLSPGQITSRALDMPGLRPFFLVGEDPQSLAWLRQRATELQEMGAAGLAVEVADTEALARIQAAAPGITILPVNGNDIATRLQIEHYPVLITATSLEQ